MAGHQQLFENGRDSKGNAVPVDMALVKKNAPWANFFVRTESGVFAFSDGETAQNFAGEIATVETR